MDSNFRFRARRNQEISVSRWSSTDLVYGTVARISAEPSGRHAREQYRADKCPVDGEGPSREALEDAQKAPDRDKGREAADNQADGEHQPAVRIEAGVTLFRQLLQAGESEPERDRHGTWMPTRIARGTGGLVSMIEEVARIAQDRGGIRSTRPASHGRTRRSGGEAEQEGEACCLLALEAEEKCRRQRRAGTESGYLHDLIPNATVFGLLVNPNNPSAEFCRSRRRRRRGPSACRNAGSLEIRCLPHGEPRVRIQASGS